MKCKLNTSLSRVEDKSLEVLLHTNWLRITGTESITKAQAYNLDGRVLNLWRYM